LPPLEKPTAIPEPEETKIGFKPATLPGNKASPAIDETYMLLPGLLPLVLDTAVQSDLPGPLLAHLPGPVYSTKGVLLMEAGTQIVGRYETMKQNAGSRLLATSVFAHTPNGIWVPLSGEPLADDLGRTGLDGEVNNHYLQRFGAAILLSLTDQGLGIIQAEVSKGGNTYLSLNSGGGGGGVSSLAQTILQSQINIPPTFSKHQGETMALFLDQPIDFSSSYRLRTVGFKQ
jgi:type IV secretion system protein VirB10